MIALVRFSLLSLLATPALSKMPPAPPTNARKPVVTWTFSHAPAHPLRPEAKFSITLLGVIAPGWHLYALEEPSGGPLETSISLADEDGADLLHVEQSQPDSVIDATFDRRTLLFRAEATFKLNLAIKPHVASGPAPLHIAIRYQACNDHLCMPPHTDVLTLPLSVLP